MLEIVEKKGGEGRDKESRGISIGGRGQDMGWFLEFNQRRRGGKKAVDGNCWRWLVTRGTPSVSNYRALGPESD